MIEYSWTAYERSRAHKIRATEHSYTSSLTPRDYNRLMRLKPFLGFCIRIFTLWHARCFFRRIKREALRQKILHGKHVTDEITILNFHTFLGSQGLYWKPLYRLIRPLMTVAVPRIHTEEMWDIIIPLGYKALKDAHSRYPQCKPLSDNLPITILWNEAPDKKS